MLSGIAKKTGGSFIYKSKQTPLAENFCDTDTSKKSWVWSTDVDQNKHSCTSPPTENIG